MEIRCNSLIMIVDDNHENIKVLARILEDYEYDVMMARNGDEALQSIALLKPDLVLLDIMMPEMDGYEVCRRLKENEESKNIPIIFLSAKNDTDDIVKGFKIGAADYVSKPFIKDELLARIETHIKLKRLLDEVHHSSMIDGFSKTYNRTYAYKLVKKSIENAENGKGNLIICYFDMDNLKNINDCCGHQFGDQAILTMVDTIKNCFEDKGVLCRVGGDEFIGIFQSISFDEVEIIIKNTQDTLRGTVIEKIPLSFSVGIEQYRIGSEITEAELIRRADKKMYNDKFTNKCY